MSHGGKGDSPRPYSVDQKTFESNWEATFGKKQKQQETQPEDQLIDGDLPKDSDQDG
jgi:hypothetical protein